MRRLAFSLVPLLLGLLVLLPAACSEGRPAGPAASYVGGWSGTTSQGRMFRFYVDQDGIGLAALRFEVVGTICTRRVILYLSNKDAHDHFSLSGSSMSVHGSNSEMSLDLVGSLSSGSASGTFTLSHTTCDGAINETWTASRATGPEVNVAGTWEGTQSSNLGTDVPVTFDMTQSGATLGGSYSSMRGGYGTVSGTVSGKLAKVSFAQTTPGCTGRFDGYAVLVDEPAGTEYVVYAFDGQDCLGSYTGGWGYANRVGGVTAAREPTLPQ